MIPLRVRLSRFWRRLHAEWTWGEFGLTVWYLSDETGALIGVHVGFALFTFDLRQQMTLTERVVVALALNPHDRQKVYQRVQFILDDDGEGDDESDRHRAWRIANEYLNLSPAMVSLDDFNPRAS